MDNPIGETVPVNDYPYWTRGPRDARPFALSTLLKGPDGKPYHCTACFPFKEDGFDAPQWPEIANKWLGSIAVGGTGRVIIMSKLAPTGPTQTFQVPFQKPDVAALCIAWAISAEYHPLVVFTYDAVIRVLDVETRLIVSKLRGHGGEITSIVVDPKTPYKFCTTSKDFTIRLYDLTLGPMQMPNNTHWLPLKTPSRAGPAHGLHMTEPEGEGSGQCVVVFVGGRSGGHKAAALCAAYHPTLPLLATGGMDRCVKIWRIPPTQNGRLAREDKPLFSTDLMHKARVLSISWLDDDVLISRSAPALMREDDGKSNEFYHEDGTVIIWRWLALNRFFPPSRPPAKVMRGTANDYRNSESFQVFSAYHLPAVMRDFRVFRNMSHDPVLLIPVGQAIRIFKLADFRSRKAPKFHVKDQLTALTERMHIRDDQQDASLRPNPDDTPGVENAADSGNEDGARQQDKEGNEREADEDETSSQPPPRSLSALFDSVESWEVSQTYAEGHRPHDQPELLTCEMALGGRVIVSVAEDAWLAIWQLQD